MHIDQEFCEGLQTNPITYCGTWQCIIIEYLLRSLTMDSDKLPAIAGLARKFWSFCQDDVYLAGLWKKSLMDDLLWAHKKVTPIWYNEYINPHRERWRNIAVPPRGEPQR
jgi:hypothetical protein